MNVTFTEVFVLSLIAAAMFWVLCACVRWLMPLILAATWLAPVSLLTWLLWVADDVLGGTDHPGVALFLHVVTSIVMGRETRAVGPGQASRTVWTHFPPRQDAPR